MSKLCWKSPGYSQDFIPNGVKICYFYKKIYNIDKCNIIKIIMMGSASIKKIGYGHFLEI